MAECAGLKYMTRLSTKKIGAALDFGRVRATITCSVALVVLGALPSHAQFHDIIAPQSSGVTEAFGIDGSHVVGSYVDAFGLSHGYTYDISAHVYASFDAPLGVNGTVATGIQGNNQVGYYNDVYGQQHGFVYNGSAYNTIDLAEGPNGVAVTGISGNYIVGTAQDYFNPLFFGLPATQSFVMNLNDSSYTIVNQPDALAAASNTILSAISGNTAVGGYYDANNIEHGMIYDIFTGQFTTVDDPLGTGGTVLSGLLGDDIVGYYIDSDGNSHGMVYDIATGTFQTVDNPRGYQTILTGIAVSNNVFNPNPVLIGYYLSQTGNVTNTYGFWYQEATPEPGTLALLLSGAAASTFALRRRRKSKAA